MKAIIFKVVNIIFRGVNKLKRLSNIVVAKNAGLSVGEETLFIGFQDFGSEPFLISIGRKCLITDGVQFVTHDGSIQVPLLRDGVHFDEVYSKKSTFGKINIGNNVFVGVQALILPNTTIGDNCIVAAGAVVKGSFPDGSVIAGNPARIVSNIEAYYEKNISRIIEFSPVDNRKEKILRYFG
ncbi:MAG TPA: acyltransferase [Pseudomonas sp.]|uniref:acyltransferase n=1 Tax=Pseudomonas sp. TaxID=306 RepID=UPI002C7AB642|nr:acyltransferase [Pseudomonas sp.]HRL93835.1 acyltransferase [Pseudomonas sp.]